MAVLTASTLTGGNLTVTGRISAKNGFSTLIRTWSLVQTGSYLWYNIFADYHTATGWFVDTSLYNFWIRSSNGTHYYGYRGVLLTGGVNYGPAALSQRYIVRDLTDASSSTTGSCTNAFSAIDNNGFTYSSNSCSETLSLYVNFQMYY